MLFHIDKEGVCLVCESTSRSFQITTVPSRCTPIIQSTDVRNLELIAKSVLVIKCKNYERQVPKLECRTPFCVQLLDKWAWSLSASACSSGGGRGAKGSDTLISGGIRDVSHPTTESGPEVITLHIWNCWRSAFSDCNHNRTTWSLLCVRSTFWKNQPLLTLGTSFIGRQAMLTTERGCAK